MAGSHPVAITALSKAVVIGPSRKRAATFQAAS